MGQKQRKFDKDQTMEVTPKEAVCLASKETQLKKQCGNECIITPIERIRNSDGESIRTEEAHVDTEVAVKPSTSFYIFRGEKPNRFLKMIYRIIDRPLSYAGGRMLKVISDKFSKYTTTEKANVLEQSIPLREYSTQDEPNKTLHQEELTLVGTTPVLFKVDNVFSPIRQETTLGGPSLTSTPNGDEPTTVFSKESDISAIVCPSDATVLAIDSRNELTNPIDVTSLDDGEDVTDLLTAMLLAMTNKSPGSSVEVVQRTTKKEMIPKKSLTVVGFDSIGNAENGGGDSLCLQKKSVSLRKVWSRQRARKQQDFLEDGFLQETKDLPPNEADSCRNSSVEPKTTQSIAQLNSTPRSKQTPVYTLPENLHHFWCHYVTPKNTLQYFFPWSVDPSQPFWLRDQRPSWQINDTDEFISLLNREETGNESTIFVDAIKNDIGIQSKQFAASKTKLSSSHQIKNLTVRDYSSTVHTEEIKESREATEIKSSSIMKIKITQNPERDRLNLKPMNYANLKLYIASDEFVKRMSFSIAPEIFAKLMTFKLYDYQFKTKLFNDNAKYERRVLHNPFKQTNHGLHRGHTFYSNYVRPCGTNKSMVNQNQLKATFYGTFNNQDKPYQYL